MRHPPRNLVRPLSAVRRISGAVTVAALILGTLIGWVITATARPDSQPLVFSLDEAVERALSHNRTIRDAELAIDSSGIGITTARSVFATKIRPLSSINYSSGSDSEVTVWEVGGAVSKTFHTGVRLELRPSIAYGDDEYDAGIGFSVAVPLLRGLGTEVVLDQVRASEFAYASALRSAHRQRVAILLETIRSVYAFVKERQLIELYQRQIAGLQKHRRLAAVKEKVGLARSMDVFRVEIRLKEVEDSLNLARERLENAEDQLKSVLALPLEQAVAAEAPLRYSVIAIDPEEAVTAGLSKRIEIKQGRADVDEALRRSRVARLNIKPELDLEASYERRGRSSEFDSMFIFDEDQFQIGLSSTTDFARTVEKSRWRQSRIEVNRARLQFATIRETITRDVRRVLNALEKSEERIRLRREQIAQAGGKQRLAQVKFQHGEADNFDLIESQTQLQQAKVNLVADEIQYIIDGYRLRSAMGTLLEYDGT